jgi:hypothetical protein
MYKYTMKDIHESISDIEKAESTIFSRLDFAWLLADAPS